MGRALRIELDDKNEKIELISARHARDQTKFVRADSFDTLSEFFSYGSERPEAATIQTPGAAFIHRRRSIPRLGNPLLPPVRQARSAGQSTSPARRR